MPNILIIGATGYIGTALSQSLVRSGDHRVYGLARSPEKALSLSAAEVTPILSTSSSTLNNTLTEAISTYRIDVIVDVSGANQESSSLLSLVKQIGASRLSNAQKSSTLVPKFGFIYCSGTWVHGSSNGLVNDLMPVGTEDAPTAPAELVAWRCELEKEVLEARDVLDVMVVRPALVYGRSCAIWTGFFEPLFQATQAEKGGIGQDVVKVAADEESRPGLVHVDDVASGFHCAVDKLSLISGTGVYPVFDLQTSQESMRDILAVAAKEMGCKGKVALVGAGEDLFAKAMCTTGNCSSGRAKSILGWVPRREGFVEGMEVFVRSWESARR
ncbi:NAD(P)-binding protein [Stipitochalara longipes BDJ]|nr:NAD(P)-binding protein [Stipitochalara longipes BDJ]